MTRIAQLLDADRRVVARVSANSDKFMATMTPEAFARIATVRFVDRQGHVLGEVPLTKGTNHGKD